MKHAATTPTVVWAVKSRVPTSADGESKSGPAPTLLFVWRLEGAASATHPRSGDIAPRAAAECCGPRWQDLRWDLECVSSEFLVHEVAPRALDPGLPVDCPRM
jgi:hypothetical protein